MIRKFVKNLLNQISPEVSDHFEDLVREIRVAIIHKINSRKLKKKYKDRKNIRVNFGCGEALKDGFLNLDFSALADARLDLRRHIPLMEKSCSLVYSEHFLEHLSYPEGTELFISECFRVLEPGGVFSVSVPDTQWPLLQYANESREWLEACKKHNWHPHDCNTYMEHINYHFRQRWRGCRYSYFENHRFAWDYTTMKKKLSEAGFVDVVKREYDERLDSEHRKIGSLFVDAKKPLDTFMPTSL